MLHEKIMWVGRSASHLLKNFKVEQHWSLRNCFMFVSFSCIAENSSLVINWLLFLLLPDCLTLLLKKKKNQKWETKLKWSLTKYFLWVCLFCPPSNLSIMTVFNLLPVAEWHLATLSLLVKIWSLYNEHWPGSHNNKVMVHYRDLVTLRIIPLPQMIFIN